MSRKIRYGIVGCGRIAVGHIDALKNLSDLYELSALCDVVPGKAEQFAQKMEVKTEIYDDFEAMLAQSDVEAVSVCTQPVYHCPVSVKCLDAGWHVVTEKPLALNVNEVDRMIEASRRNGRIMMGGQSRRFNHPLRVMKRLLDEGSVGDLVGITVQMGGDGARAPILWWADPAMTGPNALLANWGSHSIDWILYLADEIPSTAYAIGKSYRPGVYSGHDHLSALLSFKSGLTAEYTHSFAGSYGGGLRAHCRGGELVQVKDMVLRNGEEVEGSAGNTNDFTAMLTEFHRSIAEGREPETSALAVRGLYATIDAIEQSLEKGEVVQIDQGT